MGEYVTWVSIVANLGLIVAIMKMSNTWENRLTKLETKMDILMLSKGTK